MVTENTSEINVTLHEWLANVAETEPQGIKIMKKTVLK